MMISSNTNQFVFKTGFILAGFSLISIASGQAPTHPNVILIITDDQGYGDFGFTGNHHVKTPFIDKLAKESVRFNNFYVSPVSAPTRSSLMTGRYSLRTGVKDTYNGGAIMAASEVTIAEILNHAGYSTGHFGKWHLGDNFPFRPIDQGFDESVMHLGGGMGQPGDITTYFRYDSSYFDPILWHNGSQQRYKGYCSDIFADQAINFIENNKRGPFFCYLAFNAPHTPLQLPEKYYNMYKDIDPSSGFESGYQQVMSDKDKEDARKVYGMVTNIDDNIGRVLGKLNDLEITQNTIVIFMTDNGPQQKRYVTGLKGLKGSVYNGGVKVPLLIWYPALASQNTEINSTAAHIDILPTITDMCNIKLNDGILRDGISLLPEITGKDKISRERELFFYWTRHNPEMYNNMAFIKGDYKLVCRTDYDAPISDMELYDLTKDPSETASLVKEMPEVAATLFSSMNETVTGLTLSKNLTVMPCIVIGDDNENPVILNRNDADGQRGIWDQEDIFGKWRVSIKGGYYNIIVRFLNPVPDNGVMMIETGSVINRKRNQGDNINIIELRNVRLPELECDLIPFYEVGEKRILPFSVELRKI